MNIFFLSLNPVECAKWHVNKHVVKMILETVQLLCSAIWLSGLEAPYKLTHKNHPCAVWTRANKTNWNWLKELGLSLCSEYTYRYGKVHKSEKILLDLKCPSLSDNVFFEPPQAMPDKFKVKGNSIEAYRAFYSIGKRHLHAWKNRDIPKFISEYEEIYF